MERKRKGSEHRNHKEEDYCPQVLGYRMVEGEMAQVHPVEGSIPDPE